VSTAGDRPAGSSPAGPLAGVLIADFSRVLAGPLTTMWLADLGATVVKVEHAARGDDTRHWGPPWLDASDPAAGSAYFEAANRSKLSLSLDLSDPADLEVARALAARADVVVENFLTGRMAGWGLDHATLAAADPRVISCSITGFGSGAGADLAGYDFLVQALGGLMSITGAAEAEPTKVGVALVDVLTAKDAAIGILAALSARDRDGVGQHVEVNLLSSLLGSLANQASGYLATGNAPGRMGNRHPSIAPYELLRCRDGELLAVACGNDGQFAKLAAALGIPEVAGLASFATNAARVAHREALVELLEGALSSSSAAAWEERLVVIGVPAGRVGTVADGFARAAALGLEPVVAMPAPHPAQVAHPIRYSASPVRRPAPPSGLGADAGVVREWLAAGGSVADLDAAIG
jgi:crotonobetainyl-CoA:carnitine CoA-transferase CaiB-like acyl-CoA transferase